MEEKLITRNYELITKIMESKIDLSAVKALSKEQRFNLANLVRKDPELWNAIHGIGGLSENSAKGIIQGDTTFKRDVLPGVDVTLKNKQGVASNTKTNQYGFFKVELVPDLYTITFTKDNSSSEPQDIELQKGITFPVNYDFEKLG